MAFNPKQHMMRVQGGREYLPVSARLIWFREEHPNWGIVTAPVEINMEKQYAIFSASIFNDEGKLMATATKMENVRGFPDWLEKAETGAVGRALAYCGFGTQFAPELEEGSRLADAPYGGMGGGNRPATAGGRYGSGNGGGGGGNFGGGGGNMPAPPRSMEREAAPAARDEAQDRPARAPERPAGDVRPAGDARPAPARPATAASAAPLRPRPAAEDDLPEPDEDDDPFAELDEPAPARSAAPPARAAAARAAAVKNEEGEAVLTTDKCSEEGCPVTLTPSQVTMSMTKFGRALCPRHQRDATPATGGGGGAAAKRGKPEMADTLL